MFTLSEFLKSETAPSLGCTEPGAVALAVARAKEEIAGNIKSVKVIVSRSIFKNGASVGVPGTKGLKGNAVAAAVAALYGKSAYGLEVLKDTPPEGAEKAKAMLAAGIVSIEADMAAPGIYIRAIVNTDEGNAVCVIRNKHDNIVEVEKNGKVVYDQQQAEQTAAGARSIGEQLSEMSFEQTFAVADSITDADVENIMRGVDMNMHIADYALEHNVGLGLGKIIYSSLDQNNPDIALKIKAITSAGADARMSGAMIPVMSSAGSGNHGLTAIIPVAVLAEHLGKDRQHTAKAIAISHLVTSYVKSRTGRLTPICGCTVAAGAGAAAAMAWLLTDSVAKSADAVSYLLGNLSGLICDGAKESCSMKVGSGAIEAYYAALLAKNNTQVDAQGIIGKNVDESVRNLAHISIEGMKNTDDLMCEIIDKDS